MVSGFAVLARGSRFNSGATFGSIAAGNYAEFDANGFLTFYGAGRSYRDFNFAASGLGAGATAPGLVAISGGTILYRSFDGNVTTEQLFGGVEMDHMWAEGTVVRPHVHWYATTEDAGNVVWRLTWQISQDGALTPEATVVGTGAANGVGVEVFTNLTAINLAGYKIGAQFNFRLWRFPNNPDGLDTYGADAAVATFGLHVIADTLGSRTVAAK